MPDQNMIIELPGQFVALATKISHFNKNRPKKRADGSLISLTTYLPALSTLRLAALRSTTALNFAPATSLGTVDAGMLISTQK